MSIDKLQKAIRKLKSPLMIAFSADFLQIPPQFRESTELADYLSYTKDLLVALKENVPAVRFNFGSFAVYGEEGIGALSYLLEFAGSQGYYVLLDAPEVFSPHQAELVARGLFEHWCFDGLVLACYMGTDTLNPFVNNIKETNRDIFVTLRTPNKSASELQDLFTGGRLVHTAAADMAKRLGEGIVERCGYSRVAGVGPGTSADVLQNLRKKYANLFLLVDALDYPGANAKICAEAFDRLGHGAIVCASTYVTGAWRVSDGANESPVILATHAAERLKKNLNRYVTIL